MLYMLESVYQVVGGPCHRLHAMGLPFLSLMQAKPCAILTETSKIAALRASLAPDHSILISGYEVFTYGRQTTGVLAFNVLYAEMVKGLAMYSTANANILFEVGLVDDLKVRNGGRPCQQNM